MLTPHPSFVNTSKGEANGNYLKLFEIRIKVTFGLLLSVICYTEMQKTFPNTSCEE